MKQFVHEAPFPRSSDPQCPSHLNLNSTTKSRERERERERERIRNQHLKLNHMIEMLVDQAFRVTYYSLEVEGVALVQQLLRHDFHI
jgi:hypothetical protein